MNGAFIVNAPTETGFINLLLIIRIVIDPNRPVNGDTPSFPLENAKQTYQSIFHSFTMHIG